MKELFTATLSLHAKPLRYQVSFLEEGYLFLADDPQNAPERFVLKRENDKWQAQQLLPEELKHQAIAALEAYLLRQH